MEAIISMLIQGLPINEAMKTFNDVAVLLSNISKKQDDIIARLDIIERKTDEYNSSI